MNKEYYYISVGEKSHFYTLNYSYMSDVYSHQNDGIVTNKPVRLNKYIRNLSHNIQTAIHRAKEYHAVYGGDAELRLPTATEESNELLDESLIQSIESKVLPTGKYSGSHVSDVSIGYVHWVIANLYNPNKFDTPPTILGAICYEYAIEKGWFDSWVKRGNEIISDSDFELYINNIITNDVMYVGKYAGLSLHEQTRTNNHRFNNAKNYLIWFAEHDTLCDHMDIAPTINPDGTTDNIVTCYDYYIYSFQAQKITDFELSVYVARKFLNDKFGMNFKTYKFNWNDVYLNDLDAVKLALNYK